MIAPSNGSATRPHRTTVTLRCRDERQARLVVRSLDQEVGAIDDERSETWLARRDRVVELTIEAADLVALRAAVNTWLSLASIAEQMVAVAGIDGGVELELEGGDPEGRETVDF